MSFLIYDLTFLVLCTAFVVWFLHKNKKNLKREGVMYLYRTKLGIKAINYTSKKFSKTLHVLKYVSIVVGIILMITMVWMFGQTAYIYAKFPQITQIIKAPPIAPLIPYFPELFGVTSFFPPFYFIYFIIALLIVAVVHEFSHGIFMKLFNMKIKSTGFAFLGPFLGAFVEEDKGQMYKRKNLEQMAVLSAGVFANIIFALIFFLLLVGFFFLSFQPAGYIFNSYSYSFIPVQAIKSVNESGNYTILMTENQTFYLDSILKQQLSKNLSIISAYDAAPAIEVALKGAIIQINDKKIRNQEDLQNFLKSSDPGESVLIKTNYNEKILEFNLTLGENPTNNSIGYLGIGRLNTQPNGFVGKLLNYFMKFKDPSVYYAPRYNGQLAVFIYDLLWWIMIINLLVGLFNMLPVGILDGGRFFYLLVLSATKSEKVSKNVYKIVSIAIGLLLVLILFFWFIAL